MKNILILILFTATISCGSYHSINSFYNKHKNDDNVTAIRVPQFMLATLSGLSPEMNSITGNINDLRYINLPTGSNYKNQLINAEMNTIINNSFVEIFRKNEGNKRSVISVREKKDTVREIIVFNNSGQESSVLYFNGYFNPAKIRALATNNEFDSFTNSLNQHYNFNGSNNSFITPGITN